LKYILNVYISKEDEKMGFLSDFINKNGEDAAKGLVNVEAILKKLDEIWNEVDTTNKLGLVKLNGSYTFTGTINVPTPALPS
jgi:hypothetical protein